MKFLCLWCNHYERWKPKVTLKLLKDVRGGLISGHPNTHFSPWKVLLDFLQQRFTSLHPALMWLAKLHTMKRRYVLLKFIFWPTIHGLLSLHRHVHQRHISLQKTSLKMYYANKIQINYCSHCPQNKRNCMNWNCYAMAKKWGVYYMQYLWLKKTIKIRNSSFTSIIMLFSCSSISDVGVSREIKIGTMYIKNREDPA